MKKDTSENGLETLIMRHLTGTDGLASGAMRGMAEAPSPNRDGWLAGSGLTYDRQFAVDTEQLLSHGHAAGGMGQARNRKL